MADEVKQTTSKRGGAKPKPQETVETAETAVEGGAEVATDETAQDTVEQPKEDVEGKVIYETKVQLPIHRNTFHLVRFAGATVKIKNLGYGDAYVHTDTPKIGHVDHRIATGEEKVFEGATIISFTAASQPVLHIQEIM